ncbi:arsenite S-adenosylmethyltransferase [Adhaeribacter aerolatus]|uniref:Arsenite methyltransferase n=1 Tax=Adhaeribacter aerolatus TaxID=670289 RepID=A0A512B5X7_9BACT|nr:arsenite methyltransferase [Adhaeribacter aerolatus]GEO07351.1 arsenite S-adenosylmethyltransferase [Adhaeribacter aerolatus]
MKTAEELKQIVKEKYSEIALQSKEQNETSCCGATGGCATDITIMAEDYTSLPGYAVDADLGLGCGLPTEYAHLKPGETVLDLGSGAGNDCFVARSVVGETGKVIGVDMTEAMIEKAKVNAKKLGYTNVEFRLGEIEDLPLAANRVDVVVSNCVLNLVPDKEQAFKETYRVLKPQGHFSISDVVLEGELPAGLQKAAEMYAGCVSGAIQQETYLALVEQVGFVNIQVKKKRLIYLPDDLLANYLSPAELESYKASGTGIYSITVYAEKPATTCCTPGSGCC